MLAQGLRRTVGTGETVAVGALDLVLGHPRGVVSAAVGHRERLLLLVLVRPAVDEMRGHLAGRDVDDQKSRRAVGQRKHHQVRQVRVDVVANPLRVLPEVSLLPVDPDDRVVVGDAVDEQSAACVGHGADVLGELVPLTVHGGNGQVPLPVEIVGLGQLISCRPADHVVGERARSGPQVLMQTRPRASPALCGDRGVRYPHDRSSLSGVGRLTLGRLAAAAAPFSTGRPER